MARTPYIILLATLILIIPGNGRAQGTAHLQPPHWMEPDTVAVQARPDRPPRPAPRPYPDGGKRPAHGLAGGIDVSHYQGRIDWDAVARDPRIVYVYLKATEGTTIVDDTYAANFEACKRLRLKVGSYLFFRPRQSPRQQFELFRTTVPTGRQDLLPVIDAEVTDRVSPHVFQTRLLELCALLEAEYGCKPLIYTGRNFYKKHIHSSAPLRAYPLFLAAYTDEEPQLEGGRTYILWQYTDTGRVDGIMGDVDMSRFVDGHTLSDILIP